jgi:integrase
MRSLARSIRDGRAQTTTDEYQRVVRRLDGQHWRDYAEGRCLGKRSASVLRAAYRYHQAGQLLDALRQMDRARKAGDPVTARICRHQAETLAGALEKIEPPYQPPGPVQSRKASKRRTLSRLPSDWRERVIQELKPEDRLPAVVLALTGCRPAEFLTGVLLEWIGEDLQTTVFGSKVSDFTQGGQPERVMVFDGSDAFASWLLELVGQSGGSMGAGGDLGAWRKRFSRAALRLGFRGVSPYNLRHQFSGDQKQRGWNDDRLSRALGHASERSRKHYGHHLQGKGRGGGLKAVTASKEVRHRPQPAPAPEPDRSPGLG